MSKQKKLYIMFICTLISALLVPIFTQWYKQNTGVFPGEFCIVLFVGGFISFFAVGTNNFKDL